MLWIPLKEVSGCRWSDDSPPPGFWGEGGVMTPFYQVSGGRRE